MSIITTAQYILEDLQTAIEQLSDEQFASPNSLINASVGQHSRHIIEFFQCLEEQTPEGSICYDLRQRKTEIETSTQTASLAIDGILAWLQTEPQEQSLQLLVDHSLAKEEQEKSPIKSSLHREIAFNVEHAIHHMAIFKISLKYAYPNIELAETFGLAPSTYRHQQRQS